MRTVFKSLTVMVLLAAAAPAWSQDAQGIATASIQKDNPDGKGQPNAVTCPKPQQQAGSRLMAPAAAQMSVSMGSGRNGKVQ